MWPLRLLVVLIAAGARATPRSPLAPPGMGRDVRRDAVGGGGRWEHQVITMGQESIGKMAPGPH